jgi:hypothetical protein
LFCPFCCLNDHCEDGTKSNNKCLLQIIHTELFPKIPTIFCPFCCQNDHCGTGAKSNNKCFFQLLPLNDLYRDVFGILKNHFDPFVAKMTTVEGKPKLIIDLSINCIHQMMHTELIPKFCAFIGRFIAKMTTVEWEPTFIIDFPLIAFIKWGTQS